MSEHKHDADACRGCRAIFQDGEAVVSSDLDCEQQLREAAQADLATAQKRIAELEALIAQHPEQLRRVAEATVAASIRALADAVRMEEITWESRDHADVLHDLDLEHIIAEATKPPTS